jgi:hypothetical protein
MREVEMKRIGLLLGMGAGIAAVLWGATSITANGDITAAAFVGDGSQLTNVDATSVDGIEGTALDTRLHNAETLVLMVQDQVTTSLLCRGGAIRYLDLGDGTVWDCQNNLQWLKDAGCLGTASWYLATGTVIGKFNAGTAGATCEGYAPGSYNDWRLATKAEWDAALADANALSCSIPALTSDLGARQVDDLPDIGDTMAWVGTCAAAGPLSFTGVLPGLYWSSSSSDSTSAMVANLSLGDVSTGSKSVELLVWPVRGGP